MLGSQLDRCPSRGEFGGDAIDQPNVVLMRMLQDLVQSIGQLRVGEVGVSIVEEAIRHGRGEVHQVKKRVALVDSQELVWLSVGRGRL
jgi:hypothetical protein